MAPILRRPVIYMASFSYIKIKNGLDPYEISIAVRMATLDGPMRPEMISPPHGPVTQVDVTLKTLFYKNRPADHLDIERDFERLMKQACRVVFGSDHKYCDWAHTFYKRRGLPPPDLTSLMVIYLRKLRMAGYRFQLPYHKVTHDNDEIHMHIGMPRDEDARVVNAWAFGELERAM